MRCGLSPKRSRVGHRNAGKLAASPRAPMEPTNHRNRTGTEKADNAILFLT
jgi:hypothetical protein